jgi:hypothetical protein
MRDRALRMLVALAMLAVPACGGVGNSGAIVGGPCTTDADCDKRCLTSGDFPGGTCSMTCGKHDDCPGGSKCVDKEGGVCLLECELPEDCRGGYTCKGQKNQSGGGESLVCLED